MKRMALGVVVLAFFFIPYCIPYKESLAIQWKERTFTQTEQPGGLMFEKEYKIPGCVVRTHKDKKGLTIGVHASKYLGTEDTLIQMITIRKVGEAPPVVQKEWTHMTEDGIATNLIESEHRPPDLFQDQCRKNAESPPTSVKRLFFNTYGFADSL